MHFLAPSLLLGLTAAALPYLIHRIGKRRALPIRFAAMQLLLRSERRAQARRRLREILLLLARTAVAASLPFIFARPFAERTTDLPVVILDAQAAVIVLFCVSFAAWEMLLLFEHFGDLLLCQPVAFDHGRVMGREQTRRLPQMR